MDLEIRNIDDLRAKIALLKIKKQEDEIYLNQKYISVKEKLTSPFSFVKNLFISNRSFSQPSSPLKADFVTSLGRILIPLFLNKTILRNRGFLFKTIVSLISQKTINSSVFNKDVLSNWIDKATGFVKSKTKKEKRYGIDDYGIPPESETA
ncbi:hypothetical protein [Pedobacter alpinus]|uniref:DUF4806 domain-containing protein n=1 Tax=Pedobacter alpinus TaxID=1590643 RepID=A0ABW5TN99_9SPHI